MRRPLLITLLAIAASIGFSTLILPHIAHSFDVNPDPDRYGELGRSMAKGIGLIYDSSPMPVTDRGPGYPAFLALIALLTGSTSITVIQIAQAILHGATSLLVYLTLRRLTSERAALVGQLLCALFPTLIWYSARIWAETLLTFLAAMLVWLLVVLMEKPNIERLIPVGLCLGLFIVTKSVLLFFPFVLCVIWYFEWGEEGIGRAALVLLLAGIIVMPWTVRNSVVLKRFLPVHTTLGINLWEGNVLAENIGNNPLASYPHWIEGARTADIVAPGWSDPMTSYDKDHVLINASLGQMHNRPGFVAKRLAVNLFAFFYLGETPIKSIAFILIQLPLAFLALLGLLRGWKHPLIRSIGWLFLYYVLVHACVYGTARFAAPMVPAMIMLAFAGLHLPKNENARLSSELAGIQNAEL